MKILQPSAQTIALPALDGKADTLSRHFYAQFMHAFHAARGKTDETRILRAIETTAKKTGAAADIVAKTLVDCGLRAGQESFPPAFVTAVETGKPSSHWKTATLSAAQHALAQRWKHPAPARKAGPRNIERVQHRRTVLR